MDIKQFKCPNCGGPLQYDPEKDRVSCEFCRSLFTVEELEKLQKPEAENADGEALIYNCPSCGAQIMTDETTAATFCYYCHNPVVLAGRLEGAYKPDYIVPFQIDRKKALSIFENWVKKKKYVPREFYSKDQIEKFSGVYFPYMLYTCNIAGYVDGEARKTSVTVQGDYELVDRAVYHVHREGNMEVKHVLRNALKKANRILSENVLPFNLDELKPFSMTYLSGFMAEKRDMGKEDMEAEVTGEVRSYAVNQLQSSLAGYENVRVTDDNTELLNEKWEYALLPVWTLTYKDKDKNKIYYFSINGQNGKTIGELPIDRKKLFLHALFIGLGVCILCMLVLYIFF